MSSFSNQSSGGIFNELRVVELASVEDFNSDLLTNDANESTVFVEFMLSTIKASLIDAISMSDGMIDAPMDKLSMRWKLIEKHLQTHNFIMNADVRTLCGVSSATANRILGDLTAVGKLERFHENGHWKYRLL